MQHWVDTGVILGVVIINALIGFLQEGKAERALDAIRNMLSLHASVLRDGHRQAVPAESLVPGDVVWVESGDKVPADLRLIEVKSLQVQEAALTGESLAVGKNTDPVEPSAALGDRSCMVYAGTLVASGRGKGVVVGTGDNTEIGRISTMLSEVTTLTTPLMQQLARFSRALTVLVLALAAFVFGFGVLVYGFSAEDMFLAAVGLAVAAIPEGLAGDHDDHAGDRRAAHGAPQRHRSPAARRGDAGLGQRHLLRQDRHADPQRDDGREHRHRRATHRGHRRWLCPQRSVPAGRRAISMSSKCTSLREMLRGAMLCSDAVLRQGEDGWLVDGDPTEGALVVVGVKAGARSRLRAQGLSAHRRHPVRNPSTASWRRLHHDHDDRGYIYVKGAPERILQMCERQRGAGGDAPLDAGFWRTRIDDISARGQRVLALAFKPAIVAAPRTALRGRRVRTDAAGDVRARRSAQRRGRRCRAALPGRRHPGEDDHRRSRRHRRGHRPVGWPGQPRLGR